MENATVKVTYNKISLGSLKDKRFSKVKASIRKAGWEIEHMISELDLSESGESLHSRGIWLVRHEDNSNLCLIRVEEGEIKNILAQLRTAAKQEQSAALRNAVEKTFNGLRREAKQRAGQDNVTVTLPATFGSVKNNASLRTAFEKCGIEVVKIVGGIKVAQKVAA